MITSLQHLLESKNYSIERCYYISLEIYNITMYMLIRIFHYQNYRWFVYDTCTLLRLSAKILLESIFPFSTSYNSWSHIQPHYNLGRRYISSYSYDILRRLLNFLNSIPNRYFLLNRPKNSFDVNNRIRLHL